MLQIIDCRRNTANAALEKILARPAVDRRRAERRVAPILADVKKRGDAAANRWSRELDGVAFTRLTQEHCAAAWLRLPRELQRALKAAARNIEQVARWQMPRAWTRVVQPGVRVGQIVRPLAAVGCYVPGGRHPLPSSVLMTAIPARVAGVKRIVAVSPRPADAVLGAAHLAGVTEMYQVGGAQAIAAMAYGTATLARVEKIVGPGNSFVTAAKHLVRAECAIDFLAGPTEVLVIAASGADPEAVAADLLAQAEHDPEAAAWLVTPSPRLARAVGAALARQLAAAPNPVAATDLRARGAALVVRSLRAAVELSNRIAPEHLTVPASALAWVTNAGSVFVGDWAPQAAGDYATGTNHVLPTGGDARARGGLSVLDFVKIITVQQPTRAGLRALAPTITALAAAEGLPAHAASVTVRASRRSR